MANNLYAQFRSLVPQPLLLLGTVVSSVDGVSIVELLGGEVVTVRGGSSAGSKVFVRAGAIESEAPNLPFVSIDV